MSKNNRPPLSKQIGLWDNASSEKQQQQNTVGEIKRAFNKNNDLSKLLNEGKLQINVRGSLTKNNDISQSSDIDIQAVFPASTDLIRKKDTCEKQLTDVFGKENVIRHNLSLKILPSVNRKGVDLIVCKQADNSIIAYHDKSGEKTFYPQIEQSLIGQKNIDENGKYSQMVRAFKSVRNEMKENDIQSAEGITSYLIECLLFSIKPRTYKKVYNKDTEKNNLIRFNAIIQSVGARLSNWELAKKLKEVNQKNSLFVDNEHFKNTKEFWKDLKDYIKQNYNMGA